MSSKNKANCVKTTKDQLIATLVSSGMQLEQNRLIEQMSDLEKWIKKFKNVNIEGKNPEQILFPEEIWFMIFKQMDCIDSLRNCYNTCRLFRVYVRQFSKDLVLFREVLTILYKNKYLTAEEILNSRLVSKSMCCWIDHFYESRDSWMSTSPQITISPSIHTHFQNQFPSEILQHPRNPFIGRTVTLLLPNPISMNNNRRSADELYVATKQSLETCGRQIYHLSITEATGVISERLAVMCFLNCPNLKSFEIRQTNLVTSAGGEQLMQSISILDLPQLTSLVLTLPAGARLKENVIFHRFQKAVLMRFSGMLQRIRVTQWNPDYTEYDWSNLKTLQVDVCGRTEVLQSLLKMKAENVSYLKMCLQKAGCEPNATGNLQLLLEVVHSFPNLEELFLVFEVTWTVDESDIVELPPTRPEICSTSVKRIHVKCQHFEKVTTSLLVYFPHLEQVHLLCKKYLTKGRQYHDLVQLQRYLHQGTVKNIYRSVIWKILPLLCSIKVEYAEGNSWYSFEGYVLTNSSIDAIKFRRVGIRSDGLPKIEILETCATD